MARKHISLITKAKARALLQSGLSGRQVAAKMQLGMRTVNRWVEGEERTPLVKTVCAHTRILVPSHVCADCGAGLAPPPPPVRGEIPEWVREPDVILTPPQIKQPVLGIGDSN